MRTAPLLFAILVGCTGIARSRAGDYSPGPVPAPANLRVATLQVRVVPDHRDWTYRLGEPARFRITVTADHTPIDHAQVTFSVGPELMPAETRTADVPSDGLMIDGGTLSAGGFIRCVARISVAGREYRGLATAASAPESIPPFQTEPADFDAFWRQGRDELARIPMEPMLTLQPEACTDKVNVYHIVLRTFTPAQSQKPSRIYGILCEPKAPGKYPAILMVPGAGVRPYQGAVQLAAQGAFVLEIGIHGIPANLPQALYDALGGGALAGYPTYHLDSKERYYYRRVYLGWLRANDFLTSREGWDGKNLLVMGGSQGGLLAIVTAGLDARVTTLAATHPAFCDVGGTLHGRAGGWPHLFAPGADGAPSASATPEKIATTAYCDAINFARRVKVPGFYVWGCNDEVCPPTSTFAAYNVITAPKQLAVAPAQGHAYSPEQTDAINHWVLQQLGLK